MKARSGITAQVVGAGQAAGAEAIRAPVATASPAAPSPGDCELTLGVTWRGQLAGIELMELGRLLRALQARPRMATAAASLQVSYRTAWSRLVEAEKALRLQLVERTRGHGSALTPAGRDLLDAVSAFEAAAGARLRAPADALAGRLRRMTSNGAAGGGALRLAASHDLLLQQCVSEKRVEGLQIRFVGSRDALLALSRGDADLAGFHRPSGERVRIAPPSTGEEAVFLVPLMHREQGLIVARGNPLRIRDVADLARSGLRFVNRQRGAGTRAWLDRLLEEGGIDATRIAGYDIEESTHGAVAATVAAGAADVGFGLRAAADRFELGFVAIGAETYWLAGARALKRDRRVRALLAAIHELAGATRGYAVPGGARGTSHSKKRISAI